MIKLSNVAESIEPSLTRQLFNMAKEYDDVIDFTLGDPDISPHDSIKAAGCEAIILGKTRYSQNAGLLRLRETISEYYKKSENLFYDSQREIIVTVGGMEGIFLSLLSILNPNDEVIIPSPYWINYKQMVQLCHGNPVIVESASKDDLSLSVEAIRKAVTSKTKAIIINTPCNPSGLIVDENKLKEVSEIAIQNNLVVISDEVYKTLIYDKQEYRSIVNFPGMRERTVIINSLSKQFCMTGWRIGYVLAPEELVASMTKLQENVAACAPLPSQYAAIEALSSKENYSANMLEEFKRRRDVLYDGFSRIEKLSCNKPQATFYAMVNISKTGMNSVDFSYDLLKKVHVAVVPGITYGECCDRFVRIAFTLKMNLIKEGIARIGKYINDLKL